MSAAAAALPGAGAAAEHGLSAEEYARILDIMGRAPNLTELGIFSVMWSEHCSYKSSKKWLAKLPTKAPWVIHGPGENAGVIDIGDGQVLVFKMESHNHPSFIEPFQGAATGVGGILRDVFTMGARPIAIMDSLRFGDPAHAKTRHLVAGVIAGIGAYGNCVGIPTVGGECTFDPSYNGNNLVNAMAVGLARKDEIHTAKAAGPGNPVVYVGSKTGRDGIHGATMASAEFDKDSEDKRPTVQVGDPFTEKLLLEACLELMAGDAIVAIQDMGAAGLTSTSFEMASKGGLGIALDLDRVPLREAGMSAYEIMLSESQERMLMVIAKGREEEARAVFDKWELDFAVIGALTDSGRMTITVAGETAADLPIAPLVAAAPVYDRARLAPTAPTAPGAVPPPSELGAALLALMGSPDLCSKRWVWEQYDHMVMADTVARPGGDAAVVRVHGTSKGVALTTDCTPRYCAADPRTGGMQAVAEAWRNLTAVGARPLALTDCLNFGSPERGDVMGAFAAAVEGIAEASRALDFPVASGNVSFYNETEGRPIAPTPTIGGVGLIDDIAAMAGPAFGAENQTVLLIGETHGHLGASLYARLLSGIDAGAPPPVDLEAERRNGDFVRALIAAGRVRTCHDCSDGGLLVALAEMALAGDIGVEITLPDGAAHAFGFGEDQARYVIAAPADEARAVLAEAERAAVPAAAVGRTGRKCLTLGEDRTISLAELRKANEGWLPAYMAGRDP